MVADDCPADMVVLYQFWSHFLVRHFNTRMFLEFHQLAADDKARGLADGMRSLIKYYNAALLHRAPLRDVVLTHLLELVKDDDEALSILRSAWHSGALDPATREQLSADAELVAALDA